jgi:hypothetical protein
VRHTIYWRIARWIYHRLKSIWRCLKSPWGQRIIAVLYVGGVAALAFSSGTHWLLRAVCIGMLSVWFACALFFFWVTRVTKKQRP